MEQKKSEIKPWPQPRNRDLRFQIVRLKLCAVLIARATSLLGDDDADNSPALLHVLVFQCCHFLSVGGQHIVGDISASYNIQGLMTLVIS